MADLALVPETASAAAARTDLLFLVLLAFSAAITLLVAVLITLFAIRYRAGTQRDRGPLPGPLRREVELGWTLATLFLAVIIFVWAVVQDLGYLRPPAEALEIDVLAKQWMWRVRHPAGPREINRLHLPRGRDVVLRMNSSDVIHSFYLPAFRVKQDVVPGRTTSLWFRPEKTGRFRLFCAEYCGTDHSRMTGEVVVMEPEDYARWLDARPAGDGLAARGEALFTGLGCAGCHLSDSGRRAPVLAGLAGRPVLLADGSRVIADRRYLMDAILRPRQEVAAGYAPVMPGYDGILSEGELAALIAYLQRLDGPEAVQAGDGE
ncbi:cytochrome c oxidase subunit II [Marinibaculum pumilum]|uniref:cytochrome-c oxidase n=1 Tax=Marinibaculum pumilum TaxID=1766165 RepID=A0ABV7L7H9_9PROT